MAKYRKSSWQRNIRLIPASVTSKLQQLARGVSVVPVCTKRVAASELKSGVFHHLQIKLGSNHPSFPATILPPEKAGPYSAKNRNGWEVRRTDLPKISKTIYLGERPSWGDWSKGSFALWQKRMVYPVDEYGPTDYSIEIDLLRSSEDSFVFKFALDCVLDPVDKDFERMFSSALISSKRIPAPVTLSAAIRSGKSM
jgi:hypothetical protein